MVFGGVLSSDTHGHRQRYLQQPSEALVWFLGNELSITNNQFTAEIILWTSGYGLSIKETGLTDVIPPIVSNRE